MTLAHAVFVRRHGNLTWDGVLRGTGLVALASIPIVIYLPSTVGGLVAFVIVTIWVNGPIGIFLPATYEPILMLFGRIYPPLLVGGLGILGVLYVEFLNYYLYGKLIHLNALRGARESGTVRRIVGWFEKAPFFTVWMCSWSPLPYWAVRVLAPMSGYPIRRYLLATFLGRFPRLWFFAALGVFWHVDTGWLIAISVGSIILGLGIWYAKSRPPPSADGADA
ncbi:MAG TPA: VTT domain-containing protein [Gemmatimonadales bacterium]